MDNRILVVDDNREAADSLGRLLRALGREVTVTYGGQEAIAQAATLQPAIVFLDIAMPELDGYETARLIRRNEENRPVLVALTGFGSTSDKLAAYERGFDFHIPKPISLNVLKGLLTMIDRAPAQRSPACEGSAASADAVS
jgi:CheY-like chemotaxis protein